MDPAESFPTGFDFLRVAGFLGFRKFALDSVQLVLKALAEVLKVRKRSDLKTSQIWGSCGTMPLKPSRFEF